MENVSVLDAIPATGMRSLMNTMELFQQGFRTKIILGGITKYEYRTDYCINTSGIYEK